MSKMLRIAAAVALVLGMAALPAVAEDKTAGGDPVVARVNVRARQAHALSPR